MPFTGPTPSRNQPLHSVLVGLLVLGVCLTVPGCDVFGGSDEGNDDGDGDREAIDFTRVEAGLTGVESSSSLIADVNDDGAPDLLLTGSDSNHDDVTTLYLNDGSGNFEEANAGFAGVWAGDSSAGDVDNDGDLDLLITGQGGPSTPTTTLYLNHGEDGFTEAEAGLIGVVGSSSMGDVDGDGILDLVITGDTEQGFCTPTTTLYLGDGTGGFTEVDAGLPDIRGESTALVDVDENGTLDLVIASSDENCTPTAAVYLGDGEGHFTEAAAGLGDVKGYAISLADVNGDGPLDLLLADHMVTALYLGDGEGGFTETETDLIGVERGAVSIGDIDGDGYPDLLLAGLSGLGGNIDRPTMLYLNEGDGTFTESDTGLPGTTNGSASLGDLTRNGAPDLVLTGLDSLGVASATLYENHGADDG